LEVDAGLVEGVAVSVGQFFGVGLFSDRLQVPLLVEF